MTEAGKDIAAGGYGVVSNEEQCSQEAINVCMQLMSSTFSKVRQSDSRMLLW